MTDLQSTELEECDECQGKGYYLIDGIPQVCICVGELENIEKTELWHKSDTTLTLSEWLGLNKEDFANWVRGVYVTKGY